MYMYNCPQAELLLRIIGSSHNESTRGKVQALVKDIQKWDGILGFTTHASVREPEISCVISLAKHRGVRAR